MQRRAAAIYFVFFLVVGAAAYAYIGVAQSSQQPAFDVDGPTLAGNESTTIDGTESTPPSRSVTSPAAGATTAAVAAKEHWSRRSSGPTTPPARPRPWRTSRR